MKLEASFRYALIILLLLNGIPATLAGFSLITDPTGSGLKMDVSLLEFSPFKTFLIPGLILFSLNGLFSFITLFFVLMKYKHYPLLVICQGLILTGWITVQMVMVMNSSWLQLMYAAVGIVLMVSGLLLEIINERKFYTGKIMGPTSEASA